MVIRAMEMKTNAVMGVDIDYEVFGEDGMMMVTPIGTARHLSSGIPQEKLLTENNTAIRPRRDKALCLSCEQHKQHFTGQIIIHRKNCEIKLFGQ